MNGASLWLREQTAATNYLLVIYLSRKQYCGSTTTKAIPSNGAVFLFPLSSFVIVIDQQIFFLSFLSIVSFARPVGVVRETTRLIRIDVDDSTR
jgi:hypothetical protein